MHRSVLRRFFPIAPLQSFKPTSGMLYHPSYEEVIEREHREAEQLALGGKIKHERPDLLYNGTNPDKVWDNEWRSYHSPRMPIRGGYGISTYKRPQIDAFDEDELVKFYNTKDYWKRASWPQIWATGKHYMNFIIWVHLLLALPFINLWIFNIWQHRYEPNEGVMPPEAFHKHYRWHAYGRHLDEHAFVQYAEARRAAKWRDPTINPEDYIPPQYRFVQ